MKFAAKAIFDGCLCFCFRSYRWIFYGIRIIPIVYKKGNDIQVVPKKMR